MPETRGPRSTGDETGRTRSHGQRGKTAAPVKIAGVGIDIRFCEVDNPYYNPAHAGDRTNPRKVGAARNVNESALTRLEANGTIDAIQTAPGFRFRALFERCMAGTPSPGDIKERVDGGGAPDVFTEGRMRAGYQLRLAAEAMAPAHYACVRFVCGEGHSLRDLRRALACRPDMAKGMLLVALDRLADVWGLRPANENRPVQGEGPGNGPC